MTSTQNVVVATPHESIRQRLEETLREAGYDVQAPKDMGECLAQLTSGNSWSLILDAAWMNGEITGACAQVAEATGTLDGGMLALYDPAQEFDFQAARKGGMNQFIAYPAPEALVLVHLESMEKPQETGSSKSGSTGFMALDHFNRQVERGISEARAKDRNVAILCIGFADVGVARHWASMETPGRTEIEQWMHATLQSLLEGEHGSQALIGVHVQDLRLTWTRPDCLALLLPGLVRVQDVAKLGAGLQAAMQTSSVTGIGRFFGSFAMGVALCPGDSTGAGGLMDRAQKATDRARTDGSSSLVFSTDSMGLWAFERLTLEESLHNALKNDEFRIHYQPRVDAQTKEILGVEALVRWVHPQLGMVSPAQFIPLAEETGLIVPIGEWVLRQACKQNQAWREAGYRPIRVSVNLSPVQFRDACLTDVVDSALAESGLATDGLELEVTESMLMNDPDATIDALKQLKSRGLKISIDDFGTGYSSLSYLKQFPIDSLKVDRSFIRDVTTNADDAAITTAVILMGHSLKLNVVAEGVETESQLAFLQVLQCNEIQGFLFSPPVPPDRLVTMLTKVGSGQID